MPVPVDSPGDSDAYPRRFSRPEIQQAAERDVW
jgi:hypothetical protein